MKRDRWLLFLLASLLIVPILLAAFSRDSFRYPCQNPENWGKDYCKLPLCDVTRTCPEHIFKGQRDPRLGPPTDDPKNAAPKINQGVSCGK